MATNADPLVQDLLTRFRMYSSFGVVVVISNMLVIIVHMSHKEMAKKYILFTLLSVAELINGTSFIVTGVGREIQIHIGTYFKPLKVSECLMWFPWPTLLVFAGQLPAAMNLMLATERVIAVCTPNWYRHVWTWHHKALLGGFGYLICFVGYGVAVWASHLSDHINLTRICAVMEATGIMYGSIHFALVSLAYVVSFVVLLVIFIVTHRGKKPTPGELRRQKILFTVVGVSVIFVSFPNMILILNEWQFIDAGALFVGISYCMYATSSTFNLFIYLAFRKEFRNHFLVLLRIRKKQHHASSVIVVPITQLSQIQRPFTSQVTRSR
ncbi:hypothetical protein L596_020851 [Steinernema carpocapsae]|uniref:G-protein coupled receptors family 1 profile domain-containing protein n=1 Tax=Steinernema carpocapsae TaxID=34508 RepID=A0A4U5MVI0_STECR|nr:hypothetical protein L596_020851 [Steinernema carpocapsae]